ncbi:MAG: 3-phosphoshikimate 1-carboxyvinyltransferase [Elusimicrobiota bacterium]|nr:3-phosphoshikimate 1-carboxyvinyltransferase [Endomicrobiia bacterium]MDW8164889.1 3-phosphoshikimate 1-carboxyvinyltransferase [Elusimicrobiota bacterium]
MEIKLYKKNSINAEIEVAADKSITHRAIMLASLASGRCVINKFLKSKDCYSTIEAFKKLGVKIIEIDDTLIVEGVGMDGLTQPSSYIDAGNSGTTVRLLSGIVAGNDIKVEIIGDESLSKRPMKRIIEPLTAMGAKIKAKEDNFLPMTIYGNSKLKPIVWESKIPSAQVKSCVLFAGMYAEGETIYKEPFLSRNHTENMLEYLKIPIIKKENIVAIKGKIKKIEPFEITIPNDPSSASYFIAMAVLIPNSKIIIKNVCINQTRMGFINTLIKMGAKINFLNPRILYNEPVADITAEYSRLKSIRISSEDIPSMIDEIPLLAVVATQCDGVSEIRGAVELRVKESDRIKTITTELQKLGAKIIEQSDGMIIMGNTKFITDTPQINLNSYKDHRIAMSLAVAASLCDSEVIIEDAECVDISFPNFWQIYNNL